MTALILWGILLELAFVCAALLTRHVGNDLTIGLGLLAALLTAFLPYFAGVRQAMTLDWWRIRWVVLAVALAARITMLTSPILLSDDAYRYLWEGQVQLAGFNPYSLAPNALELTALRDENWTKVAHGDVPSAYPPLLLLVFRAAARVSERPEIFKWIFTVFDLATLWMIMQLLRARGQNESLALIWAWNPLVILEFAGSGHEMSLAIFFCLPALFMLETPRDATGEVVQENAPLRMVAAAVCCAAAVLSHLLALPVVLAAAVAARVKDARFWAVFGIAIAAPMALFADAGFGGLLGLTQFAGHWRFNGSVFELLVGLPSSQTTSLAQPPLPSDGTFIAFLWVKLICAAVLVAVLVWTWRRRLRPTRAALIVMSAVLLLSPTVHPWYVTWMVALACLEFSLAWIMFSGLVCLSYVAKLTQLRTGIWIDSTIVRWMEYVPLFLLLTLECGCVSFTGAARKFFQKRQP